MNPNLTGCDDVDRILLAQDMDHFQEAVMSLSVDGRIILRWI
jgi:hypothetical protein